jgi:hypothetical protein
MMTTENSKMHVALRKAVTAAIEEVSIERFKECSMFGSNRSEAAQILTLNAEVVPTVFAQERAA